ncbi:MAG: hypothetical protein RR346_06560 [Bacteroidales bacterium]
MDGYSGYDLLIDNYDYDKTWSMSLNFERLNDMDYLISYRGNGKNHKIAISIIKDGNRYMINNIKVLQ